MACGVDCCCGGEAEAAASWVIGAGDMVSEARTRECTLLPEEGSCKCYASKAESL
jgi:hypothetical protein